MKDIYSWPLNSMSLSCMGSFIRRCFSIVNTTVLHEQRLVGTSHMEELSIWRAVYKLYTDFWLYGGWALLPRIQGSSVFVFVPLPVGRLFAVSISLPSLRISFSNTGIPHFILLHFIAFFWFCFGLFFIESVATLLGASLLVPFFQQHLLTLCLCITFCQFLTIFHIFSWLLYLLWWSVISDLCWYYCNCFGVPQTAPISDGKLNRLWCVCSDCSTGWLFPCLSPSPQVSLFPETQQYWN